METDLDFDLRSRAVNTAAHMITANKDDPLILIDVARDIYLFLANRDPIVDVLGEQPEGSNVVPFQR